MHAFVGLGSNLGDRLNNLRSARAHLKALGGPLAASAVYESAPFGPPQPDYLNAVVGFSTELEARALLDRLLGIERLLGRVRGERWGPRIIDLDLLAIEGIAISESGLKIPHPEIAKRPFVLRPWMDLEPTFQLPGGSVESLWNALPDSECNSVRLFDPHWR